MPLLDTGAMSRPLADVYSVSRLNAEARAVLEGSFPLLWVEGEVSNLSAPASGHLYFTLKDAYAQVRCALFRPQRQRLRQRPENGAQVRVRARLSLYEGRGDFQLLIEHLEPAGEGALRLAWERLKQKLAGEGLFDAGRKLPLPPFAQRVGVITSPTGAAIRDVLSVLKRRWPALPVVLYPVQVQGEAAPQQIVQALKVAGERRECDLLLLVRGGGSIEDLIAFNDEGVARAIAACPIPLVSGIGHEIDFTIADLVADRRAPTPSAAAELASPDRREQAQRLAACWQRLGLAQRRCLAQARAGLAVLERRLRVQHPAARLNQGRQRLDDLDTRLRAQMERRLTRLQTRLGLLASRLHALTPAHRLARWGLQLAAARTRLARSMAHLLERRQTRLARLAAALNLVSPLATLGRGYALVHRYPDGPLTRDAGQLHVGDRIQVRLAKGSLLGRVERIEPGD